MLLYSYPYLKDKEIIKIVKNNIRVFLDMFLAVSTRLSTLRA
jgi:hypothetical protein